MASRSSTSFLLSVAVVLVVLPCFAQAFGAGNIGATSRIEGQNWRHGDIEDTLLTLLMSRAAGGKKFKDLDVKRVYFGNWLRDYSQAVDVGTVKSVSAEAIRIILWVLGFLSFGYGTKEFEVTRDRLGCYRPEEHIDNPKDYADNIDARQYDRRLRGPVDERRELSIDPRTGLKMYIATEDANITTSAGLVRNLFGRAIQLGRSYARSGNTEEWYEALRLLGTGCHCLEDFPAHSNYTELAIRNCGEGEVFPHVGRKTGVQIQGGPGHPVFPVITGTFGGVDFFHSVMGELSDKATQSEIQELEGSVATSQRNANKSVVQELLNSIPSGLIGGDKSGKADELEANATAQQMKNARISPRQPEAWTQYLNETIDGMRPILEFHDEIMQSITETIEKIPILPDLLDKLQDQINIFVFSLLAPYVLPIISQVKAELATGSSEVIQSSRDKQHIVFNDDHSSDPTHSMLSKDHFSNVLNEPAGKVASQILKWTVPQIIHCMDNESEDVNRTLTRIINGVFHHPAMRQQGQDGAQEGRQLMYSVVEKWWHDKSEQEKQQLRQQLSRQGVESGRNHKAGVHDKGHGCGKPLGMPTMMTAKSAGAIGGPSINTVLSGLGIGESGGGAGRRPAAQPHGGGGFGGQVEQTAAQAVGGGMLGSMVGGLVGSVMGGDSNDDQRQRQGGGGHGPGGRGGQGGHGGGRLHSPPRRPHSPPQRQHSPPGKQYPAYGQSSYQHSSYQQSYDGGMAYGDLPKQRKKKEDSDDDYGEDDFAKREKKAHKKAEKERKKADKRARKAQGYGSGDDDDDSDSDDSNTSRNSGRGGRGNHPQPPHRGEQQHGGGMGGGRPGRGGESYESSYQSSSSGPAYTSSSSSSVYQQSSSSSSRYESQANAYSSYSQGTDRYGESTGVGMGSSGGRIGGGALGGAGARDEYGGGSSYGGRASYGGGQSYGGGSSYGGNQSSWDEPPSQRYGGGGSSYEQPSQTYGGGSTGYGQSSYGQSSYSSGRDQGYGGSSYGRQDDGYSGRQQESYGGDGSYGGGQSYNTPGSYGRQTDDDDSYGRRDDGGGYGQSGYGGGGNDSYGGDSYGGGGYGGGGYEDRRY